MKYQEVSIGELAAEEPGAFKIGPFGSSLKKDELVSDGIPVIGIENVLNRKFNRPFRRFVTEQKFVELADYQVCPGDVLVTTMGTIGKAVVAPEKIEKMIIDSHLFRMRINQNKILPEYLCYALNGYVGLIRQLNQKARGAIMDGLNTSILKECLIPLPPLPEQQRIAVILQKADRVRRLRRYARTLSESYLQSVFLEMFGDPTLNHKKWELEEIGNIAEVKTGGTPSRTNSSYFTGNIPWVKTGEVVGGIILRTEESISEEALRESNCEIFPVNTIVVAMYGQGLTRGRTAKLGVSASTNQACAAILPSDHINSDYLWAFLKLSYQHLRDLGRGGNQPNLNLSMIKELKVPVPPWDRQIHFAHVMSKVSHITRQQVEAERQAEHLFQSLLRRAFQGEIGQ